MNGSIGPETKVQHGTATNARLHCFARRGAYVSANSQYTPIASLFLWGKRMYSFSDGAVDRWVRGAFSSLFRGFELFPFRRRVSALPLAANASRWALKVKSYERRKTICFRLDAIQARFR